MNLKIEVKAKTLPNDNVPTAAEPSIQFNLK